MTEVVHSPLLQVWHGRRSQMMEAIKRTIKDLEKDVPQHTTERGMIFYAIMHLHDTYRRMKEDETLGDFNIAPFVPVAISSLMLNDIRTARGFCAVPFASLEELFTSAGQEMPKTLRFLHQNMNNICVDEIKHGVPCSTASE